MPTYQNISNAALNITSPTGNIVSFNPLETKTSMYILSDPNLNLISDLPFYNPLKYDDVISIDAGNIIEYDTDLTSKYIHLLPVLGVPIIYINSVENKPGVILYEATDLSNKGKISILYLHNPSTEVVQVNLKEIY
jgi:hypothetical protein